MSEESLQRWLDELEIVCNGLSTRRIVGLRAEVKSALEAEYRKALDREKAERRKARVKGPRRALFDDEPPPPTMEQRRTALIEEGLRERVAFASPEDMQEWCEAEGMGCAYQVVMISLRKLMRVGKVVRKRINDPETGERLGPRYFHVEAKRKMKDVE